MEQANHNNMLLDTLLKMGKLSNYNHHIFKKIKPYLGRHILEVGAGIGNITKYLLAAEIVVATDISEDNIRYLRNNFQNNPNVVVMKKDIVDSNQEELKKYKFDTIVCLNLLEHIEDDRKALRNIAALMNEESIFVVLVPAMLVLKGSLDDALGHFRRYKKSDFLNLLQEAGFVTEKIEYFNAWGALGWFLNSRVFKKKSFSLTQARFFDSFYWLFSLENYCKMPLGISLFAVCRRK